MTATGGASAVATRRLSVTAASTTSGRSVRGDETVEFALDGASTRSTCRARTPTSCATHSPVRCGGPSGEPVAGRARRGRSRGGGVRRAIGRTASRPRRSASGPASSGTRCPSAAGCRPRCSTRSAGALTPKPAEPSSTCRAAAPAGSVPRLPTTRRLRRPLSTVDRLRRPRIAAGRYGGPSPLRRNRPCPPTAATDVR